MSWVKFRVGHGTLKIKPRSQIRSYETEGVVPTLNLGLFLVSWWSDVKQQSYDGGHWAYRVPGVEEATTFTPPSVSKKSPEDTRVDFPPP